MVTQWGLSEKMGPLTYGDDEGEVFLGRSVTKTKEISDETAKMIDEEVRAVIDRNYQLAENILRDKIDILHIMAEALVKYETIDENQIKDIMAGQKPKPPRDWEDIPPTNQDTLSDDSNEINDKRDLDGDDTVTSH